MLDLHLSASLWYCFQNCLFDSPVDSWFHIVATISPSIALQISFVVRHLELLNVATCRVTATFQFNDSSKYCFHFICSNLTTRVVYILWNSLAKPWHLGFTRHHLLSSWLHLIATALGKPGSGSGIVMMSNTAAAVVVTRKMWYSDASCVGKADGQLHGKIPGSKTFVPHTKIKSMCAVVVHDHCISSTVNSGHLLFLHWMSNFLHCQTSSRSFVDKTIQEFIISLHFVDCLFNWWCYCWCYFWWLLLDTL